MLLMTEAQLKQWVLKLPEPAFLVVQSAVEERDGAKRSKGLDLKSKLKEAVAGLSVDDLKAGLKKDAAQGGTMFAKAWALLEDSMEGQEPDVQINFTDFRVADKSVPRIIDESDEELFLQCVQAVINRIARVKRQKEREEKLAEKAAQNPKEAAKREARRNTPVPDAA